MALSGDQRRAYLAALCRNVPSYIVERVLADPTPASVGHAAFPGTLVYADLVGFTALCDRLDRAGKDALSRLSEILITFFGSVLEHSFAPHGGDVIQFGGDSLTVHFRGPDHQAHAVAAAFDACRIARGVDIVRRSDSLLLRVGIATGEVNLYVLGDATQRGCVCGHELGKRAIALQDLAEPGAVCVDAEVAAALGDRVRLRPRGPEAFEVTELVEVPEPREPASRDAGLDDRVEDKIALLELFVPPPLSNRLRAVPDNWLIEPEVRNVVIVFAEVNDMEAGDVETGGALAARFLGACRRYGGALLKANLTERGHRIMAVFGLHAPSDIDGERAVMASLEFLTGSLSQLNGSDSAATLGVGIHRGDVYYGAIGSPKRYDITLVGDAVNVAARAASVAPPFGLVVTRALMSDLRSQFETTPLGPVKPKGKSRPVELIQIMGARDLRARYLQRRRRSRRQAGRDLEVLELIEIVDAARAGRGCLVGIRGEHGVGKSFLLSHIIDRWLDDRPAEARSPIGMMGGCEFNNRNEPLAPVTSMFRSFLGLVGSESEAETARIVSERLEAYELGDHRDVLYDYLTRANRGPIYGESASYWEAVISALIWFLSERIARQPVLYILEDIHHADTHTRALIRRLSMYSRDAPFLLVATYRPVEELGFLGERLEHEYRLGNLGLRDAARAVALYFDARSVDEEVTNFLWERTRGNPGQLIELVRFLRDRGLLRIEDDQVVVGRQGVEMISEMIPPSMSQLALARIEQLGERERRLLRMASAIGRRFDRELLGQVALDKHLASDEIDSGVSRLIDDGMISPELARRPVYRFREDITRAVAYSTIPKSERQRYHRRIAEVMARLPVDQLDRNSVTLALHYQKAGLYPEAERSYRRAIELADQAGMDSEVRYLVDRWQEVVERNRQGGPDDATRAVMAARRFVSTARTQGPAKAEAIAEAVYAEHGPSMPGRQRTLFELWYGASLIALGRRDYGCQWLTRAYEGASDSELRADAALRLGRAFHGIDRALEARWLQACASQLEDTSSEIAQRLELARACVLAADGELDEARVLNARVRDAARKLDRLPVAAVAANNLADCDLRSANLSEALRGFEESAAMTRALGLATFPAIEALNQGICHLFLGRPTEARRHLEASLGQAEELGDVAVRYEAMIYLGMALALTDDLGSGEAMCEQGRALAVKSGDRLVALAGELCLLHIAIIEQDAARAARHLEACESQSAAIGAPPPLLSRQLLALRARARELG